MTVKSKVAGAVKAAGHEVAERHRARKFAKGPQLGQAQTMGLPGGASPKPDRGVQGSSIGKRAARDVKVLEKNARGSQRIGTALNAGGGTMIAAGAVMTGTGALAPAGVALAAGGAAMAVTGSMHAMQGQKAGQKATNTRLRGKALDYQLTAGKAGRKPPSSDGAFTRADAEFAARRDAAAGAAKQAAGDTFERTRRDPRSGKVITETVRNTRKAGVSSNTAAAVKDLAGKKK